MAEPWTSFADWWVRSALAGGLLLLAGLLLMRLVGQPVRRQRVGTWSVAAALLVLPLSLLPGWLALPWSAPQILAPRPLAAPVTVVPAEHGRTAETSTDLSPFAAVAVPAVHELAPPADSGAGATPMPASAPEPPKETTDSSVVRVWAVNGFLSLYAVTVLVLLTRLLAGQIGLLRLWRASRPAPEAVTRLFESMAAGLGRQPSVRVSDRVPGPVCFGVWRAKILLPGVLVASGDRAALRWVLAHELSHAERNDPLGGWLVGLARAFYFFCPWFGALRRELRLSQEYLADAAAVAGPANRPNRPEEYADFLVRLTGTRPVPLGASGVRAGSSDLFRRVTMLLQSTSIESRCPRRWSFLAAGGMFSAALVLGGLHLRSAVAADPAAPTKAEEAKKDASKEKLTPEQRRTQLEERLKKLDLNSLEYQEAMKEFEKLMEAEKAKQPAVPEPRFAPRLPDGFPADIEKALEEQNKLIQEQLQHALDLSGGFADLRLQPFGPVRGAGNGRFGVRIERPSPTLVEQLGLPTDQGLVVAEVRPDSPAAKAGLKAHDVLLELAGKAIPSDAGDFARKIRELKADEPFDVTILRKGKKEVLKGVKLPEVKAPDAAFGGPDGLPNALQFQPAEMPFPGGRAFRRFDLNTPRLAPPGAPGSSSMSVKVANGMFEIDAKRNGVSYHITGSKDGDKNVISEIAVKDGKEEVKVTSLDKVPEKHRDAVKKLLESVK